MSMTFSIRNEIGLITVAIPSTNKILKISESLKAYNRRVQEKFENATAYDSEVAEPFLQ